MRITASYFFKSNAETMSAIVTWAAGKTATAAFLLGNRIVSFWIVVGTLRLHARGSRYRSRDCSKRKPGKWQRFDDGKSEKVRVPGCVAWSLVQFPFREQSINPRMFQKILTGNDPLRYLFASSKLLKATLPESLTCLAIRSSTIAI